jgi:hypothetical protein
MPSLDHQTRQNLTRLAVLIAPIAIVQGARLFDASGPAAAPAATVSPDPLPAPEAAKLPPLTESQRRALVYLSGYSPKTNLGSPMDRPDPEPAAAPAPAPTIITEAPKVPERDPLEGVSLTAIIGRDEAAVALIRHQVRRVGDEVVPGWRIQSIDPRHRRVVVVDRAGTTRELEPPTN